MHHHLGTSRCRRGRRPSHRQCSPRPGSLPARMDRATIAVQSLRVSPRRALSRSHKSSASSRVSPTPALPKRPTSSAKCCGPCGNCDCGGRAGHCLRATVAAGVIEQLRGKDFRNEKGLRLCPPGYAVGGEGSLGPKTELIDRLGSEHYTQPCRSSSQRASAASARTRSRSYCARKSCG